ncbi:YwpF-like family protein [Alkalicoccus daliensis]|uniref:YwpF-like protein n=1 Tax=Alkalicoccus daliensis TaxID=745820 RepID=A0A1H0AE75_9BACI|nr:YwpF-like family protein [Alkalicoccus daliensis]SDN31850.1 YwpF-like protein [Alkalicoccus daliensis]
MKTFRLCSLIILFDEPPAENESVRGKEIPIKEGLIINKEESEKNWLLEAVVHKDWKNFFEEYISRDQHVMAEVTITKRTNDPATLYCQIKAVHELQEHLSIHIEGRIVAKKEDLSDMLLRNLLDEGFSGEELYAEFRRRKKDRGRAIQGILSNAYEQARAKGFDEKK